MVKIEINGVREVAAKDSTGTLAVLSSGDVLADLRTMIGLAEIRGWDYTLGEAAERRFVPPAYRDTIGLALDSRPDYSYRNVCVDFATDTGFEITVEEVRTYFISSSFEETKKQAKQFELREGVEYVTTHYALVGAVATRLLEFDNVTNEIVRQTIDDVLLPEQRQQVSVRDVLRTLADIRELHFFDYASEEEDDFEDDTELPTAKACSKCGVTKPLEQFYAQKDGLYGRRADCIECKRGGRQRPADNVTSIDSARKARAQA
ncbi:hypothetical protein [Paenibacillus ehimensis]|uniref:Uncharacterized protein n=1 Tax=Paenibacillus ehimensis TaxID=79264 RepID=A0ABT8VMG6_9BACL|nr:hypothetical protein [Paenibacillus ehimensis]MDO3682161.1 hypothetical protein [Paenibacillus ehimensis]